MNEFIEKLIARLEEHCETDCCGCCSECDFKESIEIVNKLAEEYKGGWIPCSERLPTEEQYYLVTMATEEIRMFKCKPSEKRWQDRAGCIEYGVIAWMPLPEPFQKGE